MPEGYQITIQKYLSQLLQPKPLASLAALLLLAAVFIIIGRRSKKSYNTRLLTYGAIAIAASFVLSFLKIMEFPNGGSITVASMLPLFIFAVVAGPRWGMLAGLCYGMLQYIQEPFFVHWAQFLLDYPIAFAMLGLAGLFRKNIFLGAATGAFARFVCHFISGVVFFASYAGDQNVFLYSLIYNASYILPDLAICFIILAIPGVRSAINRVSASMKQSLAGT